MLLPPIHAIFSGLLPNRPPNGLGDQKTVAGLRWVHSLSANAKKMMAVMENAPWRWNMKRSWDLSGSDAMLRNLLQW